MCQLLSYYVKMIWISGDNHLTFKIVVSLNSLFIFSLLPVQHVGRLKRGGLDTICIVFPFGCDVFNFHTAGL